MNYEGRPFVDKIRQQGIFDRDYGIMISQLLRFSPEKYKQKTVVEFNGHNQAKLLDGLLNFLPTNGLDFSQVVIYERPENLVYLDKTQGIIVNRDKSSDKKLTQLTLGKRSTEILLTLLSQLGRSLEPAEIIKKINQYNGQHFFENKSYKTKEQFRSGLAIFYLRSRLNKLLPGMSKLIQTPPTYGYRFNLEKSGLLGQT